MALKISHRFVKAPAGLKLYFLRSTVYMHPVQHSSEVNNQEKPNRKKTIKSSKISGASILF